MQTQAVVFIGVEEGFVDTGAPLVVRGDGNAVRWMVWYKREGEKLKTMVEAGGMREAIEAVKAHYAEQGFEVLVCGCVMETLAN